MNNTLLELLSKIKKEFFGLNHQKRTLDEFINLLDIDPSDRELLKRHLYLFDNSIEHIMNYIHSLNQEILVLDPTIFAAVSGTIIINNKNYTFVEVQYSQSDQYGPKRGIKFTGGGNEYLIDPNPHENGQYQKNARQFYSALAYGIQGKSITDGQNGHPWVQNNWPTVNQDRINALGERYTLQYKGRA
ncbi:hypothetical protein PVK73_28850 [Bacillus thuringiensis]